MFYPLHLWFCGLLSLRPAIGTVFPPFFMIGQANLGLCTLRVSDLAMRCFCYRTKGEHSILCRHMLACSSFVIFSLLVLHSSGSHSYSSHSSFPPVFITLFHVFQTVAISQLCAFVSCRAETRACITAFASTCMLLSGLCAIR